MLSSTESTSLAASHNVQDGKRFDNEMLLRHLIFLFSLVDTGDHKVVEVGANYVEGCNSFAPSPSLYIN